MTELQPGRIYLPENPNKAEVDVLMIDKPATSENQYLREAYEVEYTFVERCRISTEEISDRLRKTLKHHPVWCDDFINGRLCCAFGGMKQFAKEDTINRVIQVVVNDLLKEITAGRLENFTTSNGETLQDKVASYLVCLVENTMSICWLLHWSTEFNL